MMPPAFRRSLHDIRWNVLGYGVGLGVWAAVIVALFPSIRESLGDVEMPEDYLQFFGIESSDFRLASNYFQAEFFSTAPVVLVVYAVVVGTGTLAGDESNRTLELILAQPISRTRLFAERATAIVLGGLLILLLTAVGWTMALLFIEADDTVSIPKLAAATVAQAPLLTFWIALSLLLGALAPSRGSAAGVATVIAVATFLANSLAAIADQVEWLRYLSPFWYSDAPTILTGGVTPWHTAVLLAITAACFAAALFAFRSRDLNTGRLPRPALAFSRTARQTRPESASQ